MANPPVQVPFSTDLNPSGGFDERVSPEDDTSFDITLPSQSAPGGAVTTTKQGGSYRSLRERYGLPALDELGEISPQTQAETMLVQAQVNVDDPAVRAMLAEPAFQEILQGENAPGMITFLQEAYPATPTTAYDDAVLASGFTGGFAPPTIAGEPGNLAALTSGTDAQVAEFRKRVPGYEENPDTGWIRYQNGVLVSPDGQVAFDPTSTAPGSLKWQREVVSGWSPEQVSQWADRLVSFGYLSKEQAKEATSNDPGFLGALQAYHVNRYVYGKPVNGEQAGVGAAGADKPPLVDFEELQAQTRNFVREQYRRVFGEDPTDGEVVAFSDAITKQAMTLQKRFRRQEMPGFSGMAATEAEERFVERLEGSPEAEFLREADEENTRLRDSLSQAVAVTNSLAG